MSDTSYKSGLGRLVETHRPANPFVSVCIILIVSLPLAVFALFTPAGPFVGLLVFCLIAVPLTYGLGEWLFLKHCVYEHGLVLRSLPGVRSFVIPHYTIDPASLQIGGRRVHHGGVSESVRLGMDGSYRLTPLAARTVKFSGLYPDFARRLGKNQVEWQRAGDDYEIRNGEQVWVPQAATEWSLSSRTPERFLARLRDTVRESHQVRPYYRSRS